MQLVRQEALLLAALQNDKLDGWAPEIGEPPHAERNVLCVYCMIGAAQCVNTLCCGCIELLLGSQCAPAAAACCCEVPWEKLDIQPQRTVCQQRLLQLQLKQKDQLQQALEQHDAEAVTEASKLYIEVKARPSLMAVWFNAWWVMFCRSLLTVLHCSRYYLTR
jgi:hypothetical protein